VRNGPGAARTILLFHTISARPSKQPRMVGITLGVYNFGLIFVSARTNKRHHHTTVNVAQVCEDNHKIIVVLQLQDFNHVEELSSEACDAVEASAILMRHTVRREIWLSRSLALRSQVLCLLAVAIRLNGTNRRVSDITRECVGK
jgi:hypothetical protein